MLWVFSWRWKQGAYLAFFRPCSEVSPVLFEYTSHSLLLWNSSLPVLHSCYGINLGLIWFVPHFSHNFLLSDCQVSGDRDEHSFEVSLKHTGHPPFCPDQLKKQHSSPADLRGQIWRLNLAGDKAKRKNSIFAVSRPILSVSCRKLCRSKTSIVPCTESWKKIEQILEKHLKSLLTWRKRFRTTQLHPVEPWQSPHHLDRVIPEQQLHLIWCAILTCFFCRNRWMCSGKRINWCLHVLCLLPLAATTIPRQVLPGRSCTISLLKVPKTSGCCASLTDSRKILIYADTQLGAKQQSEVHDLVCPRKHLPWRRRISHSWTLMLIHKQPLQIMRYMHAWMHSHTHMHMHSWAYTSFLAYSRWYKRIHP